MKVDRPRESLTAELSVQVQFIGDIVQLKHKCRNFMHCTTVNIAISKVRQAYRQAGRQADRQINRQR